MGKRAQTCRFQARDCGLLGSMLNVEMLHPLWIKESSVRISARGAWHQLHLVRAFLHYTRFEMVFKQSERRERRYSYAFHPFVSTCSVCLMSMLVSVSKEMFYTVTIALWTLNQQVMLQTRDFSPPRYMGIILIPSSRTARTNAGQNC